MRLRPNLCTGAADNALRHGQTNPATAIIGPAPAIRKAEVARLGAALVPIPVNQR
jgi:hypothetical protein